MTPDRDIERLLDGWLSDGPIQVADRVIDGVAARITRQSQRPAWRLRPWRFPTMSTPIRAIVLAGALLAAIVAGAVLTGGGSKPSPSPSRSPSASPAGPSSRAAPSAPPPASNGSADVMDCAGDTTGCAGPLSLGQVATAHFSRPFVFQAEAGWTNIRDIPRTYGLDFNGSGPLAPPIQVMSMIAIADQTSTRCDPIVKKGVGSSVDELIAYVQGHPGLVASVPVPTVLDGHPGRRIDFTVAPSWGEICTEDDPVLPSVLMITDTANPPGRTISYTAGERARWLVIDVAGDTVIVEYVTNVENDSEAVFGRGQKLVDTIRFRP
jgi:hypothetical protein